MCLNTCFCLFWSENCAPSDDIVGLLLFSLSEFVKKTNIFVCTLIFLAKLDDFC